MNMDTMKSIEPRDRNYSGFEYISVNTAQSSNTNNTQFSQQQQLQGVRGRNRKGDHHDDKKKQIIMTMQWLEENYVYCEAVCLPRCILYSHYLDFCQNFNLAPACAATFGKMIRQKFPGITTRRLGTRGHSKYHYYGIGIRETSLYYHSMYSSKGLTRFSSFASAELKNSFPRGGISSTRSYLEDYPDISKIIVSPSYGLEKYEIDDILLRHKHHCQNIVSAALNQNLTELGNYVMHFWKLLPHQLHRLLDVEFIIDLICLADSVLDKELTEILIPVYKEDVSESTLDQLRFIAKHWEEWEVTSLTGTTPALSKKKIPIAHQFAQSVKRQSTFLHLAKSVNKVLVDQDKISMMVMDISKVDLGSIGSQAFYATVESEGQDAELNAELLKDLKDLLHTRASLEKYITWLDSILEQKVIKPSKQNGRSTKKRAQDFLLKWSFFGARVMHNLTLNNASSSGSFHLLRMLFDEYILFAVETQFNNEKDQELKSIVEKHMKKQARENMKYYSNLSLMPAKRWCGPSNIVKSTPEHQDSFSDAYINNYGRDNPKKACYARECGSSNIVPSITNSSPKYETRFVVQNFCTSELGQSYGINSSFKPSSCHSLSCFDQPIFTSNYNSPSGNSGNPCGSSSDSTNTYIADGERTFASLESIQQVNEQFTYLPGQISLPSVSQSSTTNASTDLYYNATSVTENCHQCVPVISVTGNVSSTTIQNADILDECDNQTSGNNLDVGSEKHFDVLVARSIEENRKIVKGSFQSYQNDLIDLPKSPDSVIESLNCENILMPAADQATFFCQNGDFNTNMKSNENKAIESNGLGECSSPLYEAEGPGSGNLLNDKTSSNVRFNMTAPSGSYFSDNTNHFKINF